MIRGLGIDLVSVSGFRDQVADPASVFVASTFTAAELADARSAPDGDPNRHLAARFAAKEAYVKAWSQLQIAPMRPMSPSELRMIEVIRDGWGRPTLRCSGPFAAASLSLASHVSLSHDGDHAIAVVVLEDAAPSGPAGPP